MEKGKMTEGKEVEWQKVKINTLWTGTHFL